jgi:hypothetical protein
MRALCHPFERLGIGQRYLGIPYDYESLSKPYHASTEPS